MDDDRLRETAGGGAIAVAGTTSAAVPLPAGAELVVIHSGRQLPPVLPAPLDRRARHVVSENARVLETVAGFGGSIVALAPLGDRGAAARIAAAYAARSGNVPSVVLPA